MKNIYIKYNPYKIETELTVEGKQLAENSKLGERIEPGSRLQEWVEDLPQILIDEYNDTDFDIVFHGTILDYEDLTEVFTQAYEKGQLTAKLTRIPAKETKDKEILIDQVFKKIQDGPFDELRDKEVINAFELAKSSDFEVCVIATMSAGKSTLINSMLCDKLMPSKQEACTAIITRIKDTDAATWQAEVYDKNGKLIESHEKLTYTTMDRLNGDEGVSVIKASGNIPFVTSDDVSLVLIDTPGPNNSRDPDHRRVQSDFLSKSSKALVLYIMEGTFGSDDDNTLLESVAESMAVGGKQSKDRFIFVVNKLDDRKKEDGDTGQTLVRVRNYLKRHGIVNPNLFPAAALPALNIRMISSGRDVDEDTIDETDVKVRKLNRNETLHLETFASLPASIRGEINHQLEDAKKSEDKEKEALIHTGVVSIEAAIRQYVQKYAKTAKIKNIVDTFSHKLDAVGCYEETKRELATNQDQSQKIVEQINLIEQKIENVNEAKLFQDSVDDAVVAVNDAADDVVDKLILDYQSKITERIDSFRGQEISIEEANKEQDLLEKFAKSIQDASQAQLNELIYDNLTNSCKVLLDAYKRRLKELTVDIGGNNGGIQIDPLGLMGGDITPGDRVSLDNYIKRKQVEDGEEFVKNTDKKWYKPWTWFQEEGYYRKKYKDKEYIEAGELAQEILQPAQNALYDDAESAKKHTLKQSKKITQNFTEEFKRLDGILDEKLNELKNYATNKELADERIKESEKKLKWLEEIKNEVETILEI